MSSDFGELQAHRIKSKDWFALQLELKIPGKELSLQLDACLHLLLEISFSFVISSFFLKFLVSSLANEKVRILFFVGLKMQKGRNTTGQESWFSFTDLNFFFPSIVYRT